MKLLKVLPKRNLIFNVQTAELILVDAILYNIAEESLK